MNSIYLIFIIFALVSWVVSKSLESKFERYSHVPMPLTGREVAEKMLRDNGITDVQVVSTRGHLTDHYNPATKTVNLSEAVYSSASVAAAAVAAHECGHALQHAHAYAPLRLRSALVPAVEFASRYMSWILLAGILLLQATSLPLEIGVALYAITTIFAFVTLPVEINASRRAVAWLDDAGLTNNQTGDMARSALRSAAYTYVVAALGSLATLMYYVLMLMGRRD